ncbi:hypothetical protein BC829DRAFT_395123 [Chytridium lagenaria]|nr:hypothetical protein BC829DRAFT_395123 [Chytridium lagenaria]
MVLDRGETEMVLGMGEELNKRENASSIPFVDEGNVETETVEHDIVVVMPQEPLKDESHYTSISSLISDTSTARPISSPSVSTPSTPKPVLRACSRVSDDTTPPNPNKGHRRTVSSSSQKSSTSTSSPKLSIAKRSASPSPPTPAVDVNGRRPSLTDVSVEDGKEKRRVGVRNDRSSSVASSLTGLGGKWGRRSQKVGWGEIIILGGGAATGSTGEKVGSSGTSTKEGGGVRKMFGFWGH